MAAVEPWLAPNANRAAPSCAVQWLESRALGITFAAPTRVCGKHCEWAMVNENTEYPMAQVRAAPTGAGPSHAVTVGVVLDDSHPMAMFTPEEALEKRIAMCRQEAAQAGGAVTVGQQSATSPTTAVGEWHLTGGANFPRLRVREHIRVWNGLAVCCSTVAPAAHVSSEDFDFVHDLMLSTLEIDVARLRLAETPSVRLERLLVLSHPMNICVDMPLARRALLVDGLSDKAIHLHGAPALPGTRLARIIDPLRDVAIALVVLPTQDLGDDDDAAGLAAGGLARDPHQSLWLRQVRASFHAGTTDVQVHDYGTVVTFIAPCLDSDNTASQRQLCAARPIPPRIGSDPRHFVTLLATKLLDAGADAAADAVAALARALVPQLRACVDAAHVRVTVVPHDAAGLPLDAVAVAPSVGAKTACRYFVKQSGSPDAADPVNPLAGADASELHLSLFGQANHLMAVTSRALWGDASLSADASSAHIVRTCVGRVATKSADAVLHEARYRAMMGGPQFKATSARSGSYQVLTVAPEEEMGIDCALTVARDLQAGSAAAFSTTIIARLKNNDDGAATAAAE